MILSQLYKRVQVCLYAWIFGHQCVMVGRSALAVHILTCVDSRCVLKYSYNQLVSENANIMRNSAETRNVSCYVCSESVILHNKPYAIVVEFHYPSAKSHGLSCIYVKHSNWGLL